MIRRSVARIALFLGFLTHISALAIRAQEVQVELVQPPVHFLTADTGSADMTIEPSGVAAIGDGSLLLVACDKSESLVVVETATGRIKQWLHIGSFGHGPKWEDLAHDDEGTYYVIGSRFVETPVEEGQRKKIIDVSRLLRFRLRSVGADATSLNVDPESIIEWDISDALAAQGYRRDPRKNEINIEGLTVRTLRDPLGHATLRELVFGLREPQSPLRAYAANITEMPAPNTKLALYPLFRFDAGERSGIRSQLSSIDYMPEWNGFLIVTSTEDQSNRYHGNTLWFLSDEKISAARTAQLSPNELKLADLRMVEPQKVWAFGVDGKAEGVCILSEKTASSDQRARSARVAVVYDNDTAKTGIPGLLQLFTLLRWPD